MTGSPVKCVANQLEIFKIAMSQTTLHLPADRANRHEAEMNSQLAVCLSSSKRGQPVRCQWARFSKGCHLHKAIACRFALARRLLACRLQRHLMAALFSISVSKWPIFAGRLHPAHSYFSCHILYLTVFLGDYTETRFSRGSNFECSWPSNIL